MIVDILRHIYSFGSRVISPPVLFDSTDILFVQHQNIISYLIARFGKNQNTAFGVKLPKFITDSNSGSYYVNRKPNH